MECQWRSADLSCAEYKSAPTWPIDRAAPVGRSADPNARRTNAYARSNSDARRTNSDARRTNSGRRCEHNSGSRHTAFGNANVFTVHFGIGHLRGRRQDQDR